MQPLISIIIPVYNSEKYIERMLLACINQTYRNIEIIVVNDGSSDNSQNIISKIAEYDARVCVLNKHNGGVSSARNYGMNHAHGDWLTFVDADDYIDKNYIEYLYNLCENNNSLISTVAAHYVNENNFNIVPFEDVGCVIVEPISEFRFDKPYEHHFIWGVLFHRTLICNNKLKFDETMSYCEDFLFLFNLLDNSEKIVCSNTKLYYYIKKANLTTGGGTLTSSIDAHKFYVSVISLWEKLENTVKNYPLIFKSFKGRLCIQYLLLLNQYINRKDFNNQEFINSIRYVRKKLPYLIFSKVNLSWKAKLFCASLMPVLYSKLKGDLK